MPGYEGGEDQQELRRQEKAKAWLEKLTEIELIRDALGFPVDEHIREAIIALNMSGIPTSASCEGHSDRAKGSPWIKVEALNRPRERFAGESAIIAAIAEKYHVSTEDVRTARNHAAWKEAITLASGNKETDEYQAWRKENEALQLKLAALLEGFYQARAATPSMRLEMNRDPEGTARIHNGGDDYRTNPLSLSEADRTNLAGRLAEYQAEMNAFSDFLKEKYYSSQ